MWGDFCLWSGTAERRRRKRKREKEIVEKNGWGIISHYHSFEWKRVETPHYISEQGFLFGEQTKITADTGINKTENI